MTSNNCSTRSKGRAQTSSAIAQESFIVKKSCLWGWDGVCGVHLQPTCKVAHRMVTNPILLMAIILGVCSTLYTNTLKVGAGGCRDSLNGSWQVALTQHAGDDPLCS